MMRMMKLLKLEKKRADTVAKEFPIGADNYKLLCQIGKGGSALVYRAICIPLGEEVAIKIVDIQKDSSRESLSTIAQEIVNMLLVDHPNVMKSYSSFTTSNYLWIVMPYMDSGSCNHLLQVVYPRGIKDESVLATILYETLKGLEYLHRSGVIHRDIKSGNILVDAKTGTIKLGDLGVSACLYDSNRGSPFTTFHGTPCWMAPEVMETSTSPRRYDLKADIWSFGITALELAYGHAPFHGLTLLQVLNKTLNGPPPGIQTYYKEAGNRKFSKSFQDLIAVCLVKDPRKRPCAEKLLKHSFFKKAAHSSSHSKSVVQSMLKQLPLSTFEERVDSLRGEEDKMTELTELMSDRNYKSGISDWVFDIDSSNKKQDNGLDGGDSCCCCLDMLNEDTTPALDEFKDTEMKLLPVQSCSRTSFSMLHTMNSRTVDAC